MATDPFAVLAAEGQTGRIEDLLRALSLQSRPSIENIHALLAYGSQPGVKEKFDERFGAGSAEAIIAASKKADNTRAVADAVLALAAKVDLLAVKIEAMCVEDEPADEGPDPVLASLEALPGRIASAMPVPKVTPVPPAAPVDLSGMAAALASLAAEVRAMKEAASAPRRLEVITDINGNVVGGKSMIGA